MIYYKNSVLNSSIYDMEIKFPLKSVEHPFDQLYDLVCQMSGKLYVSEKDEVFKCIDIETEKVNWQYNHKENSERDHKKGKFIVSDKYVVLGTNEGLLTLDAIDGQVYGTSNDYEISLSDALIDGDFFYFSRYNVDDKSSSVIKKNLSNNEKMFEVNIGKRSFFQLLKKDNYLYYWYDEFLYCHSSETGEELWKFDVGEIGKYLDAEKKECKGSVSGYPVFYGNTIIFQVSRNRLISLDYKTGQLEWDVWIDILNFSDLLIENNLLHAVGGGKSSYWYLQINPETGEVLLKKDFYDAVSKFFSFQPTLFTKTHFILSDAREKTILAIDRNTFENVWEYKCQYSLGNNLGNNSPTIINDKLYQLDSEGNLYVFEQAT